MVLGQTVKLSILGILKACGLFALSRRLTRRGVMIVGWHGVSTSDEHRRFESLFISPESFRKRLAFLKRHYRVIPLDQAIEQIRTGHVEPGEVVLTFDDSFCNFYSIAAPILQEFRMPATVYAVSSSIENQRPNVVLLSRDLVLRTQKTTVAGALDDRDPPISLASRGDRLRFTANVLERLQTLDDAGQLSLVERLAARLDVDLEPLLSGRTWHVLNGNEIRELAGRGYLIELHTHSHLNVVDYADRLADELRLNREVLERTTGHVPQHFCYPSGCWEKRAWPTLRNAGIVSAATTRQGPNFALTPLLALRRVLNGEDRNQLEFEFEMSNLRWLCWAVFHPRNWFAPTEHTRFKASRSAY